MKNFGKKCIVALTLSSLLLGSSGCYGSFALTKKIYHWNGTVGDKYVNSAVMWVLAIIPVYPTCGFLDAVVLNVIEFWTGSNPVALGEHEKIDKTVKVDGKTFKLSATKDCVTITQTSGALAGSTASVLYNRLDNSIYLIEPTAMHKIATVDPTTGTAMAIRADGSTQRIGG